VAEKRSISCVSYNIHQCVGLDGRRDPTRIARIIQELKADIVGLQEVSSESNGRVESLQMKYLADATGLVAIAGPTITKHNSEYGNVLLSRYPVTAVRRLDISVPGREPRGAIDAAIEVNNKIVRVIVSHLGLRSAERHYQVRRLLTDVSGNDIAPVLLIMDHNEWFPLRQSISLLHERLGKPPTLATFPSVLPFLAHDRVWVRPLEALIKVQRYLTPLTTIASDHLPLKATIDVDRLFTARRQLFWTAKNGLL
jgi:endonuclease/exonuclease/phosphatase family metal-dependent hydrolase